MLVLHLECDTNYYRHYSRCDCCTVIVVIVFLVNQTIMKYTGYVYQLLSGFDCMYYINNTVFTICHLAFKI